MSKKKQVHHRRFIASGFLSSPLNRDSKFHRLMTSDEGSFMMQALLAFSIEKLNLLITMQNPQNKIIIQDIYLSAVLIFPCTVSSH